MSWNLNLPCPSSCLGAVSPHHWRHSLMEPHHPGRGRRSHWRYHPPCNEETSWGGNSVRKISKLLILCEVKLLSFTSQRVSDRWPSWLREHLLACPGEICRYIPVTSQYACGLCRAGFGFIWCVIFSHTMSLSTFTSGARRRLAEEIDPCTRQDCQAKMHSDDPDRYSFLLIMRYCLTLWKYLVSPNSYLYISGMRVSLSKKSWNSWSWYNFYHIFV